MVTLHVDGASMSFRSRLHDASDHPNLSLGVQHGDNPVGLQGSLDHVFMYRTALTAREVEFLRTFATQVPVPAPGQWAYGLEMNGGLGGDCMESSACPGMYTGGVISGNCLCSGAHE